MLRVLTIQSYRFRDIRNLRLTSAAEIRNFNPTETVAVFLYMPNKSTETDRRSEVPVADDLVTRVAP